MLAGGGNEPAGYILKRSRPGQNHPRLHPVLQQEHTTFSMGRQRQAKV